jgi:hypothetical protein
MRRILFPILFGNREPQIRLSGLTVEENVALGTVVGTLSVVNGSGVYTFTEDDDPNELFEIDGDEVKTNAVIDYEIYPSSVTYTVIADNGVDPPITETFTITVTDVDEVAPTITSANTANVAENVTLSHTLTANETVTWSIVGGVDAGNFEISGSTLRWAGNGTQDYESPQDDDGDNAHVVQVRATDTALNTTNQTITVTVTDVAEGGGTAGEPMGLLLSLTKAA